MLPPYSFSPNICTALSVLARPHTPAILLCRTARNPFSCQHHLANRLIERYNPLQNTYRVSSNASLITPRILAIPSPGSKHLAHELRNEVTEELISDMG